MAVSPCQQLLAFASELLGFLAGRGGYTLKVVRLSVSFHSVEGWLTGTLRCCLIV